MEVSAVSKFVLNGSIVWTMTTSGYTWYTLNLVSWLRRSKVPWTLCIVCCDDASEAFFRRQQIPYVAWKEPGRRVQDGMAAFGTPSFEKCNKQKLVILEWFAKNYTCGINHSLYLDGDIVVRKDPWPLLLQRFDTLGVNILFQCECFNADAHEDEAHCGSICSGVIATKHISAEQANLYTWEKDLWESAEKQDQPFIAKRLISTATPFGMLSRRSFGNGAWQKSGKWREDDWCLIHYNYFVSGSKRAAMQKENHWLV